MFQHEGLKMKNFKTYIHTKDYIIGLTRKILVYKVDVHGINNVHVSKVPVLFQLVCYISSTVHNYRILTLLDPDLRGD